MSEVLIEIVKNAPQWIVAVVLLIALGVLQIHASQDRAGYRREIDALTRRHSEELDASARRHSEENARVSIAHDEELTELRTEVRELRQKVDVLERALDDERRLRRQAEDAAAFALRRATEPPAGPRT